MAMKRTERWPLRRVGMRAFFDGLGRVLDLGGASRLPVAAPSPSRADADRLALEGDWARIAGDFARIALPIRQR